jgi:outer membrane lipoprotein-sorting protein
MKVLLRIFLASVALSIAAGASVARADEPAVEEIVKRALERFYYADNSMRAKVSMKLVNAQGSVREREMTLLRMNVGTSGDQRYYIYFHAPGDVRGVSFLIWKYAGKESDRWIYVPTLKLVKRIAADDKRSSFVGSDFTYEDVSGRTLADETHALVRKEDLAGRPTYVVESKPKLPIGYSRRLSWIDSERWLPLKEEYFDARNEPLRTFTTDKVERIGDQWTAMVRTMKNIQSGSRTEVVFREVQYGVGMKPDVFTERYLRDPPAELVR